jgi:hypothetical protein
MGSIEIVFALLGSAAITAATMAANRTSTLIRIEGKIEPDIVMVEDYFTALKHLMDYGCLDDKTEERVAAELKSHGLKR